MLVVDFYTKPDCLLCDEALSLLEVLQTMYRFEINICDIHERDDWLEKYFMEIPVIDIAGTILSGKEIDFTQIEKILKQY